MTKRNRKAIGELADFIASERYEFNMFDGVAEPRCRSAGCIGGHAAVLWKDVRDGPGRSYGFDGLILRTKLGLSYRQMRRLCYPDYVGSWRDITREVAVTTLRRLARTGKIEFRIPGKRP